MTVKARYDLDVESSHSQFHVVAQGIGGGGLDSLTLIDDETWPEFGVGRGVILVGTASYFVPNPVMIEVHDCEPPLDLADWDHVGEASLVSQRADWTSASSAIGGSLFLPADIAYGSPREI